MSKASPLHDMHADCAGCARIVNAHCIAFTNPRVQWRRQECPAYTRDVQRVASELMALVRYAEQHLQGTDGEVRAARNEVDKYRAFHNLPPHDWSKERQTAQVVISPRERERRRVQLREWADRERGDRGEWLEAHRHAGRLG